MIFSRNRSCLPFPCFLHLSWPDHQHGYSVKNNIFPSVLPCRLLIATTGFCAANVRYSFLNNKHTSHDTSPSTYIYILMRSRCYFEEQRRLITSWFHIPTWTTLSWTRFNYKTRTSMKCVWPRSGGRNTAPRWLGPTIGLEVQSTRLVVHGRRAKTGTEAQRLEEQEDLKHYLFRGQRAKWLLKDHRMLMTPLRDVWWDGSNISFLSFGSSVLSSIFSLSNLSSPSF